MTALAIASLVLGLDPPQASAGAAQDPRCRRQRLRVARAQQFRCRRGGLTSLRRGPRRLSGGSGRAARVDCRCRQCEGRHNRFCFGRTDHCAELVGQNLWPTCCRHGNDWRRCERKGRQLLVSMAVRQSRRVEVVGIRSALAHELLIGRWRRLGALTLALRCACASITRSHHRPKPKMAAAPECRDPARRRAWCRNKPSG